jgi:hypothetical protein
MQFNDLLRHHNIDPSGVLMLRHTPRERELKRFIKQLAGEKPELFNAFQQSQGSVVEEQVKKAAYVASFIDHESNKALFVGIYSVQGWVPLSLEQFWNKSEHKELRDFYGMNGFTGKDGRKQILFFDLKPVEFYPQWTGRLVIDWPRPAIKWFRWAANGQFTVNNISVDSQFEEELPPWDKISFTYNQLKTLPRNWQAALEQWRGIYYIFDTSDKNAYVGSAYGQWNIMGRWRVYAETGDGGNVNMVGRNPENYIFSILERVSPDMTPTEIQRIEHSWMDRLHTREYGLNHAPADFPDDAENDEE